MSNLKNYNIISGIIIVILALTILRFYIYITDISGVYGRKEGTVEKFEGYGRPIGHLYNSKYTPRAPYTATNHNYGWMCVGGNCGFHAEGLLSYDECKKACVVEKANWIPPWREITI